MEEKLKRFIELSWMILEAKALYYYYNLPVLQDYEYDKLEREYDKLGKELKLPTTASDMIGFDEKRPSCQLVLKKLQRGLTF